MLECFSPFVRYQIILNARASSLTEDLAHLGSMLCRATLTVQASDLNGLRFKFGAVPDNAD